MRKYGYRFFLTLLAAVGTVTAQTPIHEERTAAPEGIVEINNLAGSVRVVGWRQPRVEVTGTLGKGTERLDVEEKGDRIEIRVVLPSGRNKNVKGTDLEVRVPERSRVRVDTVSAGIQASDLSGAAKLNTVSGRVELQGQLREVDASTVSGSIVLKNGGDLEKGDLQTVSGNIRAQTDLKARGRLELETLSGSIDLSLPGTVAADFEMDTFSGNIETNLGEEPKNSDPYLSSKSLRISTGSGGASVRLKSFSGNIRVRSGGSTDARE